MSDAQTITRERAPAFFKQMSVEQIGALKEFALHPARTVDECGGWLQDAGVQASRSAVGRWLQDYRLEEKTNRASDVARTYLATASASDPHAVTEASLRKFNELVFEALTTGDELPPGELMKISVAMKTGLGAQHLVNELKKQQAEAMRVAEAAAKSGASATDVVATIKAALGIAA